MLCVLFYIRGAGSIPSKEIRRAGGSSGKRDPPGSEHPGKRDPRGSEHPVKREPRRAGGSSGKREPQRGRHTHFSENYKAHKTYTTYTTYKNKVLSGRSAHRGDRANGVAGNFSSPSGAIKKSGSLFLQQPRSFQLNFPEKRIRQVRSFLPIPDPRHPGTLPLYPADFPDRC